MSFGCSPLIVEQGLSGISLVCVFVCVCAFGKEKLKLQWRHFSTLAAFDRMTSNIPVKRQNMTKMLRIGCKVVPS